MRPGARTDVGPPLRFLTSGPSLGFGAWAVGGTEWGAAAAEPERLAAIHRALELGVTFFDTAPTYGDGTSETLLGQALKADRDRVAIATKVGPRDDPRRSLEASLRRLATDYVDLIQLHEALDGWERRLEQLHTLQEKGKALAVGLCNASSRQLAQALEIAPVAAYQGPYNLFDRDVEQRELPLCRERRITFLAYRPLAAGLLSGKYPTPPEFPAADHRRKIYWFKGREFERRRMVVERLGARRPTPPTRCAGGGRPDRGGCVPVGPGHGSAQARGLHLGRARAFHRPAPGWENQRGADRRPVDGRSRDSHGCSASQGVL